MGLCLNDPERASRWISDSRSKDLGLGGLSAFLEKWLLPGTLENRIVTNIWLAFDRAGGKQGGWQRPGVHLSVAPDRFLSGMFMFPRHPLTCPEHLALFQSAQASLFSKGATAVLPREWPELFARLGELGSFIYFSYLPDRSPAQIKVYLAFPRNHLPKVARLWPLAGAIPGCLDRMADDQPEVTVDLAFSGCRLAKCGVEFKGAIPSQARAAGFIDRRQEQALMAWIQGGGKCHAKINLRPRAAEEFKLYFGRELG